MALSFSFTPELRLIDVPVTHPVFHSFFEIDSIDIIPQFYYRGAPVFKAWSTFGVGIDDTRIAVRHMTHASCQNLSR